MKRLPFFLAGGLLCALIATPIAPSRASDHADTLANASRPGADMADVFIFPSGSNPANVVLVMDVHPLIPAGMANTVSFDPNVLYQFKIDTSGDFVEDLVIQARFSGSGASQRVLVSGPYKPVTTGTTATFARPYATQGTINNTFNPTPGMTVFAGPRSDPFFFDLERFFGIFPDRGAPAAGKPSPYDNIMDADQPRLGSFRGFAQGYQPPFQTDYTAPFDSSPANDLLSQFNVLSIVVELPRSMLGGGVIRLWETTSVLNTRNFKFEQQDRLARPAVNEALATVAANRHMINNLVNPTGDSGAIQSDILAFMNFPAGRRIDIAQALATILVPDVMVADLSKSGPASYLGYEVANGFGGRKLEDDVIDTDLGAIFGQTVPIVAKLKDDMKEKFQFATDNIGQHTDYMTTFPYLGNPR